MKKYLTFLQLILLTIILYLCVDLFYGIVTADLETTPLADPLKKMFSNLEDQKQNNLSYYSSISQRNLFKVEQGSPKPVKVEKTEKIEKTDLEVKLLGTAIGITGREFAVIETNSSQQNLYRVGDKVENATIKSIIREKVILSRNGKDELLEMEKASGPDRTGARPKPARAGARSESGPVMHSTIRMDREQVENAAKDINQLLQQVKIRPYFEQGKPNGLVLSNIRANSIFHKMRLINGDILLGVNGEEIRSVDDALELYRNLKSSESFKLEIKRSGRNRILEYSF